MQLIRGALGQRKKHTPTYLGNQRPSELFSGPITLAAADTMRGRIYGGGVEAAAGATNLLPKLNETKLDTIRFLPLICDLPRGNFFTHTHTQGNVGVMWPSLSPVLY